MVTRYEWGVDSARVANEDLLQCVLDNFGFPRYWGRYLLRLPNFSEGLTMEEINFIRGKGIKLLPIYNGFREALGYEQGIFAAIDAAFQAQRLGIPQGIPLFADIEPFFPVNAEWIAGWTEQIYLSGYKSGIYNAPLIGEFSDAFCTAVERNPVIRMLTILWSAQPHVPAGESDEIPAYTPASPDCGGTVGIWQYSRDLPECHIDTNLATSRFVDMLW